ncbi:MULTISPECIES: hypothetical protein [unclassified Granulicatella]|uniref:hypothetical protein n=1 Tax=unclassified Granulicatella TaxID=2630493 RepID=UPI0010730A49|nr:MULTISPECIES: hypothetical protein [unclassified Granulicatella]MBF0780563.1 hypothetical protein [Granulicatella sp. 19428wC4_WM01]TFU94915.1 hypothetical protein E4T68_05575 [Granulicatella sp. WM01]
MKKKNWLMMIGIICLIGGGVMVSQWQSEQFSLNGTIQNSPKEKQLEYLKAHEQEMFEYVHKRFPKIESVQWDWSTLRVGGVSNGLFITSYNLAIRGKFNHIEDTWIGIDFHLEKETDMPNIDKKGMNHDPSILKEGIWIPYE